MNARDGSFLVLSFACSLGCQRSDLVLPEERKPAGPPSASAVSQPSTPGASGSLPASGAASAPGASSASRSPGAACTTLDSTGAVAFSKLVGSTPDERSAIEATARELRRVLEPPEEFFGTVVTAGDLVLLELWHKSAFYPENCGVRGNPGGKCRTFGYDPRERRIVSTKFWQ